mmetsp:Transcript_836/g.1628  ORF Transcript_836/g.1628 Transcript_836/m.1628 type:complete len:181 (+) Transcript_836:37-579(+)|eukprot:CAMPEP_0175152362 /NCGR_PEP_ID=MMETSP0087-20121206/19062_1 /TAXON_ID=136419 /ORGANISM="Unknown Unknown, Strain D1" /LENGTH=180 /DNA_ID=CAMNT_0016438767 /DNA_START=37 /DNA_END=579 /DNA_ORIENTATION=-
MKNPLSSCLLLLGLVTVFAQIEEDQPVEAWFYNHLDVGIFGIWADVDGNRHQAFEVEPGKNVLHFTQVGHWFEINDKNGKMHGSFQMKLDEEKIHIWPEGKEPGMVEVTIINNSGKNAIIYYRPEEEDQEMHTIDTMEPGEETSHGAWRGQIWTARDEDGNDLAEISLDSDENKFVISPS